MPNYTKLEKSLLSAEQMAIIANSRQPALGKLDDAALYALIAQLRVAQTGAGPAGVGGDVQAADLLQSAHRRASAERRKRGLKPAPASGGKPAKSASGARRAPASPARKPVGRAKAETRKTDLRTGSRRVASAKAKAQLALASEKPVSAVEAAEAKAEPKPAKVTTKAVAAVTKPAADASTDQDKARKQAVKKAVKKAAKDAEKEARKAAKKAEKEAVRAARKTAKKAAKAADKAARKAQQTVTSVADAKDSPAKKKSKPKA